MHILLNGVKIWVQIEGEGFPLLFLHPPVIAHSVFMNQIRHFKKKYKVIAFDIRGHGRSEKGEEPLTYPLIVKDLFALLDQMGEKEAILIGYSAAAMAVLKAALVCPSRIKAGILIGGMAKMDHPSLIRLTRLAGSLAGMGMKRWLAFHFSLGNSANLSHFFRLYSEARMGHSASFREYLDESATYSLVERLTEIQLPILDIQGKKQPAFYPLARTLQENLPQGRLRWIEKAGHQMPLKATDSLNRIMEEYIGEVLSSDPT
ncbi:alpha/beta fold hydrolase [Thermicanus aegyptius]|uniref:alpha/beta fold hydrolase n=1 Tax=Thermicanus aegyptius TaxID=94009 RepID=UPI00040816C8|nr:alpha/beta hydrolase [Thermicanus aegyptius]